MSLYSYLNSNWQCLHLYGDGEKYAPQINSPETNVAFLTG